MNLQQNVPIENEEKINQELLLKELIEFTTKKNVFKKYDVLYNECEHEMNEIDQWERMIWKSNQCLKYFEHIEEGLKKISELEKESDNIISQSMKLTCNLIDDVKKVKKEKQLIRKKEKIYKQIIQEYGLSPSCFSNLTDPKVAITVEFFENVKEFEYIKENVIELLNDQGSDQMNKFYPKYYHIISNAICKKMCLYILKENNKIFRNNKKVIDLLLCSVSKERELRKELIYSWVLKFSPLTKLCYRTVLENPDYFNTCLNNFFLLRKIELKRNYQNLVNKIYNSESKEKWSEVNVKKDFMEIFKNVLSIIYYLMVVEDQFFKILLLFTNYYKNETEPYIEIHLDNMNNILYNITDVLLAPYKIFLEENIKAYPKNYETCYELYQLFTVFVFKLKEFQNMSVHDEIIIGILKDCFSKEANTKDMEKHFIKRKNEKISRKNSNSCRDSISNVIWNEIGRQKENTEKGNTEKNQETYDPTIDPKQEVKSLDINKESDKDIINNSIEISTCSNIDQNGKDPLNPHIQKDHLSEDTNAYIEINKNKEDSLESCNENKSKSTLSKENMDNTHLLEKYNSKILNYTIKIQKKLENEFIIIWQQEVVSFYLSNIDKKENEEPFKNTMLYFKKIMNTLNKMYLLCKKSDFYDKADESYFQNVLDITINPLINYCLKNWNHPLESNYIIIINIFTFIQDTIATYEGSEKYCHLIKIIIEEKGNQIIQLENSNIRKMIEMDKINNRETNKIEDYKQIINNMYKFAFSEQCTQCTILNKITSVEIQNKLRSNIYEEVVKEYTKLYELNIKNMDFTYTPEQFKDCLFKRNSLF